MRRSRALAGGLALACVAAPGCGMSSKEEIKPRDPAGQGAVRGPDVDVESVDELRATEVVIDGGRFQPRQVSIKLDSTVRIANGGDETVRIRALEGLGEAIAREDRRLQPGERIELDFLKPGTERIALKGSDARLEIGVFP